MKKGKSVLIISFFLIFIGLFTIYLTSGKNYLLRQSIFFLLGLASLFLIIRISTKIIFDLSLYWYLLSIILLILVLFFSKNNAKRWLDLGFFTFQPSEIAKITYVLFLSYFLANRKKMDFNFYSLFLPIIITLIPTFLVLIEPDLGSAFIFPFIFAILLYFRGFSFSQIFILYSPLFSFIFGFSLITWIFYFALLVFIAFRKNTIFFGFGVLAINSFFGLLNPLIWQNLKEYQKERIISFLAPYLDPKGMSWSAIQAQIAIGSGRILGKSFSNPPLSRLDFIPNPHTDFIFATYCEKFGLIGVILLILLYFFLLYQIYYYLTKNLDLKYQLAIAGFGGVLLYHIFVNLGMVSGILPVTGLTLPFISYGGTSLISNLIIIGLIINFINQ
ncbi:MAG: rod shape-determining protein RodA [candidate division WOR-3 bacterium]|nr:rod shape-determining protein RodA [candidate division WOR-3 bacterium]MCX7836584.1 rod shape-determining protein RodA [candidate division WOR-3 bacterium]MDW8114164.1 rod shape-determining protein RodA [candidate division WOR-3 bacterium]